MSTEGFALFCFLGFILPVPLLAWLDRVDRARAKPGPSGQS
jgi:hypothetical protein